MGGAGGRRERVTVEQDVGTSRDAGGQRQENWQPYIHRWARRVPQGSREFIRLSHQRSDISYLLVLRRDSKSRAITRTMRVRQGNAVYHIVGVDPDVSGERREVALQCVEAT